jgi:hypothetical protein
MAEPDWNEQFEELTGPLGGLVGQGEIAARQFFGDEQFESIIFNANQMNNLSIKHEAAKIGYLKSLGRFYTGFSILLRFVVIMGVAWSIYYWIVN